MASDKIAGIVLSVTQYRDNDLLVHLISQQNGLMTLLARGAKKANSKLSAAVQPLMQSVFLGSLPKKKESLGYINEVSSTKSFSNVQQDIVVSAYAIYTGNLINTALSEVVDNKVVTDWYDSLLIYLQKIDEKNDPQILTNIFELQLLPFFGITPNWVYDAIDKTEIGEFDYSEKYNGIIEKKHYELDEYRLHVSQKAIFYLRQLSEISIEKIGNINVGDSTKRGIQQVIDLIYDRQVGLHLKSKQFIEQLITWENKQIDLTRE